MTNHLVRQSSASVLAALVACCIAANPVSGQEQEKAKKFLGIIPLHSTAKYLSFADPQGRFSLDYPGDWDKFPGAGDTIVTFAKKREATLVVGHVRLMSPLAASEITDVFAENEADLLKSSQPKAAGVVSKLDKSKGRPMIVIDYTRPGFAGPEQARQYSFPAGQDSYRLNCSAPKELFTKYDAIFAHVAESFKPR